MENTSTNTGSPLDPAEKRAARPLRWAELPSATDAAVPGPRTAPELPTRRDGHVVDALARMAQSQRGSRTWTYAVDDLLRTPGDERYPSFTVQMHLVASDMLRNPGDADEAVQQGSVSFYTAALNGNFDPCESLHAMSPAASVATYLQRAVRTRCVDMRRKQRRDRLALDKLPDIPAVGRVDEDAIAVRIAVATLPATLREVLHLRLQGHTFPMIAATLGIHRKTAMKRWDKAIELLAVLLGDDPSGGLPLAA